MKHSSTTDPAVWALAHEELRTAEERMRFALASAKAGVWEVDLRTGQVIWTESMRAVQGFSGEEFAGTMESFLALIHPLDRRAVSEAMWPATGRRNDFRIEFRALWPDGTIHWLESHGQVVADDQGNPWRVLGIAFDVTERRQLEEELVAREKRYRLLFNRSLAGVYQSTLDGRLLDCNDAFARILGYPSREACLMRTANDSYFSPQDRLAFIARLTEQRVMLDVESRLRRADGAAIWVSENASLIEDHAGELTLIEGTLIDITRRRETEVELRQVQKLESVGRLAAGVAHEINTPVQFVGDSLHFIRDGVRQLSSLVETCRSLIGTDQPADEARAALARAEDDADLAYLVEHLPKALDRSLEGLDRVTTIVRSMKEFAHPDMTEMAPVDINRAVASTLTIARNEYKYVADVDTEYGDLPLVMCHAGDINQAVLNILVNAAHAISDTVAGTEARGRIVVRTHRDGDAVVISICDNGGGIPEKIRERIFEPFFTTKEVGRGTGQGLAIARSVLREKHGGDLTFKTEPGVGTTFFLRLPIAATKRTGRSS
jgi:PAS domain S-box-containing protein